MIFSSWQQGYANVGCDRMLKYLFQEYNINLVTVDIDTLDIASIRLVEALGFDVSTQTNADFFKGSVSHEHRYQLISSLI